ncbi:hypothetical protein V6Z11_A01G132300 [Gossypium hirsutum]|uniref:Increased DNA methylation 1-like n=1 Tax=Gossypium hirsutum TaxID=3635 RepID=A0ABM2ZDI7_GOSHI|nr:increased DNA methylation 1-like [Gossypium hirsutum]
MSVGEGELGEGAVHKKGCSGRPKNSKAKSHLWAKDRVFRYAHENGKQEVRYQFPNVKLYHSLKTACKSFIDDGTMGNLEPKQPQKRKCLGPKTQPLSPKRSKKVKKQENRISDRKPRTDLSWLIDNKAVSILEKVYYRSKTGTPLIKGRITRDGIQCLCCFKVFALTAFEVHAGSTNRKPAVNIILDDGTGRSLSDCQRQVRLSTSPSIVDNPNSKTAKFNSIEHENDEACSICCYGGELICCEYCPSAFHMNCLGLNEVPDGNWFCPSCCCGICGIGYLREKSFRTCHQCELKFHIDCLSLKSYENMVLLCSQKCKKVFYGLQKLTGKPIPVGNNVTWTLLKSDHHGAENYSKSRVALKVMHECFEPTKNDETGRDVVEDVVFSRVSKLKRLNFKGFYRVIVEEKEDAVSVATLRVYGNWVAEMPLVATSFRHRRRGLCRLLVDQVEKNLVKLGVEKLILPALPTTVDTWVKCFGFTRMEKDEILHLLRYNLLDFQGTILCQKLLT